MNRKRSIRILPKQKSRVETGAVQFGDDWPGIFVRGDDCLTLLFLLQWLKQSVPDASAMTGLFEEIIYAATGRTAESIERSREKIEAELHMNRGEQNE